METEPDSCEVCGGSDTKLIDGFYYCIECGTQNTNVRETLIEEKALGDGTFAQSNRKKIVQLKKDGIEMSGEWYKWHAFNFIISGLADKLITLGAKPTFKTKLLWIWIRYIKKYQNKAELRTDKTTVEGDQTGLPSFMVEEESISESEEKQEEEVTTKRNKSDIMDGSKRDIKFLSKGVILAMLYVALNLDESEIQISHLYRFVQEKYLNITNPKVFVPSEISVKKIPEWLNFVRSKLCTQHQLRALAMSLLRKLDLGTPKVPDLKKMVDNFLTELCFSNDIKPLVYSLMHFRKCNFLDIDNNAKKSLIRVPDYEGTVMTYILVVIKICFGLDNNYEIKLSNIVEKINEQHDHPKSYKIGKYSETTNRLFSFKEWSSYVQFRKVILSKYNLRISEKNNLDIDDYVYLEQMEERPKHTEELPDKISMEIVNRIPQEPSVGVIDKELFIPTFTPLSEYIDIVIDHCQDPEVRLMLAEDFKRYSLRYVCENLELIDVDMENAVTGVSKDSKNIERDFILGTIVTKTAKPNMVYVKNCENRNWLKTNPPTIEHVTRLQEENDANDKDSDHGYDSENTSKENDSLEDKTEREQNVFNEILKDESSKPGNQDEIIKEEEDGKNIFDDDFVELDIKDECDRNNLNNYFDNLDIANNDQMENDQVPDEDFDRRSDVSDEPLLPPFNPDTFDREQTIKELILLACSKHKIPIPSEYKTIEPRKRKPKILDSEGTVKRTRKEQQENKTSVKELLSNYYSNLESDFVTKVQQGVSIAVKNAELANGIDQNKDFTNINDDITEGSSVCEHQSQMLSNHSDVHSAVTPVNEENADVSNKSEANEKAHENNEDFERNLFEQDEEMNLDDLIQKGESVFDENKYEINQLYIEVKEKDEIVIEDIKTDSELEEILVKKIKECEEDTVLKKKKSKQKPEEIKMQEQSDSDDDTPLNFFKEQKKLIEDMFRQEDNYEKLIKKDNISDYKYWIRHYDPDFMLRSTESHTKFDAELKENTPSSFYFVIQECASILNCSKFNLYKNMQSLEEYLISRTKK